MKNKFVSIFSWSFLDKITTQGISLIVSIILARMIDPEHYGVIALALIVVELFDIFVNPGICSALIQKKDVEDSDFNSVFVFNLAIGTVLFSVICLCSPFVESFFKTDNLSTIIRVMALKIPFGAVGSIQYAYVQKFFLYKRFFWVSSIGTFLAGAAGIITAFLNFGVWSLAIYSLGNTIIDTVLALLFIPWKPKFRFSKLAFSPLFSFGVRVFFVKIIDFSYEKISELLIGKKYTTSDLACNEKGKRFPQLIINNIINPLSEILFPSISKIQEEKEKVKELIRTTSNMSIFILFPVLFGFFSCADIFVVSILTDKWVDSIPYLRLTCITLLTIPLSTIIYQGVKGVGKSKVLLLIETLKKMFGITCIILAVLLFKSPIYIAIAVCVTSYFGILVDFVVAKKQLGFSIIQHFLDNIKTIVACLLMSLIVLLLGKIKINSWLLLFIQVSLGCFAYLAFSLLLRNKCLFGVIEKWRSNHEKNC